MARFRRSAGRFRSSKPLHPTKWCADATLFEQVPAGNSNIFTICSADEFEEFTNPTIVRIRGTLHTHLTITDGLAAQNFRIALGIKVVPEDYLLGNLQSLMTDEGLADPYMWVGFAFLTSVLESTPMFDSDSNTVQSASRARHIAGMTHKEFEIDVRAMRRVPNNSKLILAYSTDLQAGTPDLHMSGIFRVLVKE